MDDDPREDWQRERDHRAAEQACPTCYRPTSVYGWCLDPMCQYKAPPESAARHEGHDVRDLSAINAGPGRACWDCHRRIDDGPTANDGSRVDMQAILADPGLRADLLASMSDPGPDGTHIPDQGGEA